MSLLTAGIQLADIERIQIYTAGGKSLPVIKAETGADYIINGTLYNMTTGAVNCHLRADGKTIAKPDYKVSGYSWNAGNDISIDVLPNETMQNYIACTPLVISGVPIASLTYDPGQGGSRARSAIGIKDSRLMLYCNTSGKTPEQLRDDLYKAGWRSAVMLDGGGSTQCDFDGETIKSSRNVQHYILVFTKKPKKEETPMAGVKVKAYSRAHDGLIKLSPNFAVNEFACSDGSDAIFISDDLVALLQKVRDHYGKPVQINSAYRTHSKNKAVGGAQYSQHLLGTAADITISGVSPKDVAAYVETLIPRTGGIGIYKTFTHIDVRGQKARWNG